MRTAARSIVLPLATASVLAWCAAAASDEQIDVSRSSIVATFRQENVPVDAPFRSFSGSIRYDAARPDESHAEISVATGSLDLGDEAYNAEVRKPSWFDSARYPQATFHATRIAPGAAGRFDATGALTIKGRTQTVTLTISSSGSGNARSFDGSLNVSRKDFGIGDPAWDDVLDDEVHVRFHLLTAGN